MGENISYYEPHTLIMDNNNGKSVRQLEELKAIYHRTRMYLETLDSDLVAYRADSNAKNFKLDRSLSILEKAKTIPFTLQDNSQMIRVCVYLQRAQTLATLNILEANILFSLGLDNFDAGRYIEDSKIHSLWIANILPSFHPPGMLVKVATDNLSYFVFGGNISEFGLKIHHEVTLAKLGQIDEVDTILKRINLLDREGASNWLDGLSYELSIMTISNKIKIKFGNPTTTTLVGLEKSLLHTGKEICKTLANPAVGSFLSVWQGYVRE